VGKQTAGYLFHAERQRFTEDILKKWFVNISKHTGIKKFVFSGGVAQNIKAVKAISEMKEVEDILVCPAAGDTSLSIGAAYYGYVKARKSNADKALYPEPLKTVYLGNDFTDSECTDAIRRHGIDKKYKIIREPGNRHIAKLIASGHILGRFCGRMEFGLRALGNRSILADPRNFNTIKRLNEKIKNRDFWMPFTPTVLDKYADRYIQNPKKLKSPFMTMAFETTEEGRKVLPAAIHPADFTARPQILKKEDNFSYYELIECFAKLTGVGALLNTSFNLHGYPIVGTLEKAIETFENSELDGLILNSILVLRKSGA
jgi:carbamoyltransferase